MDTGTVVFRAALLSQHQLVTLLCFNKVQQCHQLIKPKYLDLLYEWNFNWGSNDMLIRCLTM